MSRMSPASRSVHDSDGEQRTEAKVQKVTGILIGAAVTALLAVLLTANAQRATRSALLQPPPPAATVTVPAEQPDSRPEPADGIDGRPDAAPDPGRARTAAPSSKPSAKAPAPPGALAAACAYSTDRATVLARGSTGPAVRQAQCLLNTALGLRLSVDGDFGPATDQAVRRFQTCARLTDDGRIGPATWRSLTTLPATCRTA